MNCSSRDTFLTGSNSTFLYERSDVNPLPDECTPSILEPHVEREPNFKCILIEGEDRGQFFLSNVSEGYFPQVKLSSG